MGYVSDLFLHKSNFIMIYPWVKVRPVVQFIFQNNNPLGDINKIYFLIKCHWIVIQIFGVSDIYPSFLYRIDT
jgi:hypothetical protein